MASMLDVGLLQFFSPVFLFIFVFAIAYAVLDKFDVFKTGWVKTVISLCMGVLFLFSKDAILFVNFITPWFIVFVVIVMFFIALFLFMGVKKDVMVATVQNQNVYWPVLIILFVLLTISIVHVFGEKSSPYEPGEIPDAGEVTPSGEVKTRESEGMRALISPKLLGAIILLIIMTIAIATLSKGLG
ncbi:MAG: hypothetical protein KKG60_03080 [Nanoarchaeota archaeon]|nr:hypothetical protein [Nanoarchaeota archaeon]